MTGDDSSGRGDAPPAVPPETQTGGPPAGAAAQPQDSVRAPLPLPPPLRGGPENRARPGRGPRPDLLQSPEPVYREVSGYRLRIDPPDLARLRELPGSKGKTDRELGEEFLAAQGDRLKAAISTDVPAPSEIRVVVDPYSRQAFLALENRIRGITSF